MGSLLTALFYSAHGLWHMNNVGLRNHPYICPCEADFAC